jgi:hypothetical protein
MSNLFYIGKQNFPSMSFLLIMVGSATVDISLPYGLTSLPYPRLVAISSIYIQPKQFVSNYQIIIPK